MIEAGRVTVNGVVAKLGDGADPDRDVVALDGTPLRAERLVYWMAHKPRGVLTTLSDPEGRPVVVDLLPPGLPRLSPVGRLDIDTEGLVLLTNDGALTHALLHPSLGNEREYRLTVRGRIAPATLRHLAEGVALEDGPTAPARVGAPHHDVAHDTSTFTLTVIEGRKRQIRRALSALGHPVVRLVRIRMGPLRLGDLPPDGARPLTAAEIDALRRHARGLAAARDRTRGEAGR